MSILRRILLIVLAIVIAYPLFLAFRIWQQSRVDEVRRADAIVVLGAAQYDGEPSPVFEARLDQAEYLYSEDLAPRIVVTGGKQEGDRFSESEVGRDYLVTQGVPDEVILSEDEGRTTLESLTNVHDMAADNDIDTVLLVSDPLHSERIKAISTDLGFDEAYASWTSYTRLNRSRETKLNELLHEVAALAAYEVLGR
ncbi:MAG TPA: YdcF family protein [Actinomycetota bacterium]|nr:YdcF family protein [Actinomycetota bacterium]